MLVAASFEDKLSAVRLCNKKENRKRGSTRNPALANRRPDMGKNCSNAHRVREIAAEQFHAKPVSRNLSFL
jgi:hypothetical protein